MNEINGNTVETAGRRIRRPHGFWAGILLGGLLGGVAIAGLAWTGARVLASGFGFGPGAGHGHFAKMSPEACQDRVDFAAEWVLRKVDATPEQTEKVKGILGDTAKDLCAMAERHRRNHDALLNEFTKPVVDREAVERIRKSGMQMADEATIRIMNALTDASDVLTQEQRKELVELIHAMHQ